MDEEKLKKMLTDFSILEVKRYQTLIGGLGAKLPNTSGMFEGSKEIIEKEATKFIKQDKEVALI